MGDFMEIAKGCWQREMLQKLLNGERISNCSMFLKGKALSYSTKYERSLDNLFKRLEQTEKYKVVVSRGPKGGYGRKIEEIKI